MKKVTLILACMLAAALCRASTFVVDNDGPADFNNIQAAIDASAAGDVIIVNPGAYTGPGNCDINFKALAITIRSADPNDPNIVSATIIDSNGTQAQSHRGFHFASGEGANSILDGLTITGGFVQGDWPTGRGGAIACFYASNPTIKNCVITGNISTVGGGGIYCYGSSPTLINCVISENFANFGGGIYNSDGSSPVLTGCTFIANTAQGNFGDGGAMANQYSAPTLNDCDFIANLAFGYGGGAITNKLSSPILTNCTFAANDTTANGGAVRNYRSNPLLVNCLFTGNTAGEGGGIYNISYSSPSLLSCTFSNNSAFFFGGALSNWYYSSPALNNCIFAANSSTWGGAIESYTAGATVANCIFTDNLAISGAGHALGCDSYNQIYPSNVTITDSIIWDGNDEIWNNDNSIITITFSNITDTWPGIGNIAADPCFVSAGCWDPNGTPQEPNDDFWVDGDYHLKSEGWRWDANRKRWTWDDVTSRCIDAGNPGSPFGQEPLDVPEDPNNKWGQNIRLDMGAYGGTAEASIPPHNWAILGDLTNDGTLNLYDLENWAQDWLKTASRLPPDLDRNGVVDFSDFALLAQDWLEQTIWH